MGHIEWAIGELDIEGFLKDSFLCNHQQENYFVTLTGIVQRFLHQRLLHLKI